jgi:NAD(P)-dependent dehydrogenase (short-subunit alcohol dehydrogenase family)
VTAGAGRLSGKVAIVTGGAAGIGRATARLMAAEGASVAIGDIDVEGGERTVVDIQDAGGQAVFVHADVACAPGAEDLVNAAIQRYGGLHVLHNNAYWSRAGRTVLDLEEADWDRTLAVCLKSMYLMTRLAIPHMLRQGGGSIVNMASAVALMGTHRNPAYAAAKGAVISFTKAIAIDFSKQGIRVNCVAPGPIATQANAEARREGRWAENVLDYTLLARTGEPVDVARAVVYLASDDSSYITGTTLIVDGGATSSPRWGLR